MKNSSDKNEKVVQTKGGFSYLENEKKALDDYLAQLAAENKHKANTQAKTTYIGNNNVQIKNESVATKQNETIEANKLCNDNRNIIQEKPFNQKVEDIKINNTRVNNSFLPHTSSNLNETSNKNTIKPDLKTAIQADFKQLAPTIEKKEVPLQKLDRIDMLTKKFEMNTNNIHTNQGNEESKVTVNNGIKTNPIVTANNLVLGNTSTYVNRNSLSFVPNMSFVPSSPSKSQNFITKQVNNSNPVIAAFPVTNIDKKNNNANPLSNVDKNKEQSCSNLQENNIQNYGKEVLQGTIFKKDTIKETQTLTTPILFKKVESSIKIDVIMNNEAKTESSESIKENDSEVKSSNSIKEIQIVPALLPIKKIESKINSITNKEKKEDYSQPIKENEMVKNMIEVKTKDVNKILIESKPLQIQEKSILVGDYKKIEEKLQIIPAIIDKKIEKTEKINIINNDITKIKPTLNEVKEPKPAQILDLGNRQSMLQMMNRLDLKMAGTKIPIKIEAKENNVPIISSTSGKLDMSKKIKEMTRHMTQEQESTNSSAVSSEVSIVPTITETLTSEISQAVQTASTIPSVPKIPVGIPKVPKMPSVISSIPPIPNIQKSIPPVPKGAGIPPVPGVPKLPLPTKNAKSIKPNNCVSEMSISEQIAKGVQLKKVEASEKKIEKTSDASTSDKRESKMNMFEEMKKLQLKKVNK